MSAKRAKYRYFSRGAHRFERHERLLNAFSHGPLAARTQKQEKVLPSLAILLSVWNLLALATSSPARTRLASIRFVLLARAVLLERSSAAVARAAFEEKKVVNTMNVSA